MSENTTNYTVTITAASKELTKRERIQIKDTADAIGLDQATQGTPDGEQIEITPEIYCILSVHNEAAKGDKDYKQIVIIDTMGNKWVTGSNTFINSFLEIAEEMGEEQFAIRVIRVPSKNYTGKDFLKAVIV